MALTGLSWLFCTQRILCELFYTLYPLFEIASYTIQMDISFCLGHFGAIAREVQVCGLFQNLVVPKFGNDVLPNPLGQEVF